MRKALLVLSLAGALLGAQLAHASWQASAGSMGTVAAAAEFPPLLDAVPDVLGVVQAGAPLLANVGRFRPTPTSATYAWMRCSAAGASCADIAGATGSGYTAQGADAGTTLRVRVTPVNGATPGTAVVSEPTPVVVGLGVGGLLGANIAASTPAITGPGSVVGTALSAVDGVWNGLITTVTYRWRRCDATGAGCADIAGATGASYTPTAADRGRRLRLVVAASLLGLLPSTATTVSSDVIA